MAAAATTSRRGHHLLAKRYPSLATASMSTPTTAVNATEAASVTPEALLSSRLSEYTNMYGTIKPAIASFRDWKPVAIGRPPESPAAAKAARATGGVRFANRPK